MAIEITRGDSDAGGHRLGAPVAQPKYGREGGTAPGPPAAPALTWPQGRPHGGETARGKTGSSNSFSSGRLPPLAAQSNSAALAGRPERS